MIATLKEKISGGFYCSECRMSTSEPVDTCPFCGSIMSNWMDIIIEEANKEFTDKVRDKKNESNICR